MSALQKLCSCMGIILTLISILLWITYAVAENQIISVTNTRICNSMGCYPVQKVLIEMSLTHLSSININYEDYNNNTFNTIITLNDSKIVFPSRYNAWNPQYTVTNVVEGYCKSVFNQNPTCSNDIRSYCNGLNPQVASCSFGADVYQGNCLFNDDGLFCHADVINYGNAAQDGCAGTYSCFQNFVSILDFRKKYLLSNIQSSNFSSIGLSSLLNFPKRLNKDMNVEIISYTDAIADPNKDLFVTRPDFMGIAPIGNWITSSQILCAENPHPGCAAPIMTNGLNLSYASPVANVGFWSKISVWHDDYMFSTYENAMDEVYQEINKFEYYYPNWQYGPNGGDIEVNLFGENTVQLMLYLNGTFISQFISDVIAKISISNCFSPEGENVASCILNVNCISGSGDLLLTLNGASEQNIFCSGTQQYSFNVTVDNYDPIGNYVTICLLNIQGKTESCDNHTVIHVNPPNNNGTTSNGRKILDKILVAFGGVHTARIVFLTFAIVCDVGALFCFFAVPIGKEIKKKYDNFWDNRETMTTHNLTVQPNAPYENESIPLNNNQYTGLYQRHSADQGRSLKDNEVQAI